MMGHLYPIAAWYQTFLVKVFLDLPLVPGYRPQFCHVLIVLIPKSWSFWDFTHKLKVFTDLLWLNKDCTPNSLPTSGELLNFHFFHPYSIWIPWSLAPYMYNSRIYQRSGEKRYSYIEASTLCNFLLLLDSSFNYQPFFQQGKNHLRVGCKYYIFLFSNIFPLCFHCFVPFSCAIK